jgi:precorrin-8X/cobalt-precorrin-8 methylmutase
LGPGRYVKVDNMTKQQSPYLEDPSEIYRRSFKIVRDLIDTKRLDDDIAVVAQRLVHATAMPSLVDNLIWTPGAAAIGRTALAHGGTILADGQMVVAGITSARLPSGVEVMCTLGLGTVPGIARRLKTTRAAAAVTLWEPWLEGAVVAIGNAPTALFKLLDGLASGWPRPALILGLPVGFVGAAEAKQALAEGDHGVPFIALKGQLGGSAMAAAAVNALCGPPPD